MIDGGFGDVAGMIVIGAIQATGQVLMGGLSGTLDVKAGVADSVDEFSTINIDLTGDYTGTINIKSSRGDGNFGGHLDSNDGMSGNAKFQVYDNGQGGYGDLRGRLTFGHGKDFSATSQFIVEGDVDGSLLTQQKPYNLQCQGDMNGQITVGRGMKKGGSIKLGDADSIGSTGDVTVDGDVTGTGTKIEVDDPFAGDVTIGGDLLDSAVIEIKRLNGTGRVLIDGLCDADVVVLNETVANSLIRMTEGLDDNDTILINSSAGDFDAGGDIHVGPDDGTSTDPVVFEGCTRIYDNNGQPVPDHGDLNGDITVNGCHATADDLKITVDGDINGSITINQPNCSNQVTHSEGDCP